MMPGSPHTCDHCGRNFSRLYGLRQHVRRVHGGARVVLPCWLCNHGSRSIEQHRRHMAASHPEPQNTGPAGVHFSAPVAALRGGFRVHRARFNPTIPLTSVAEHTLQAGVAVLREALLEHRVVQASVVVFVLFERLDRLGNVVDMDEGVFRARGDVLHLADAQDLGEYWRRLMDVVLELVADFKTRGSDWVVSQSTGVNVEVAKTGSFGGGAVPRTLDEAVRDYLAVWWGSRHVEALMGEGNCFARSVDRALELAGEGRRRVILPARLDRDNVKLRDVDRVESANPGLVINVVYCEELGGGRVLPVRASRRRAAEGGESLVHVNLLLLCLELEEGKVVRHYLPVTNMKRLMSVDRNPREVCPNCCQPFYMAEALARHRRLCDDHAPARLLLPEPGQVMSFKKKRAHVLLPVVGVCDFEACMEQPDVRCVLCGDSPGMRDKCQHRTTRLHLQKPMMYHLMFFDKEKRLVYRSDFSGPPEETMEHFYAALLEADSVVTDAVSANLPMRNFDAAQFAASTACYLCNEPFSDSDGRVRDHDHYTGRYLGAAHRSCNLMRRVEKSQYPVFMHNLSNYDSHFVIQYLRAEQLRRGRGVTAIPINGEKFKVINLFSFRFVDSLNFMTASLAELSDNLRRSGCSFDLVRAVFPDLAGGADGDGDGDGDDARLQLLLRKGVCPYEWVRSAAFLRDQPSLPDRAAFHSSLTESGVSDADYAHAQRVFDEFGCANMLDYVDLYCKLDVVLLAECIFAFRQTIMRCYGLDMAQYITLPQLAFDAMLKMTGTKIGLISDVDQLLMVEGGIRGGVSYINQRHAAAAADPDDPVGPHVLYVDANNLYGHAQSHYLPLDGFEWVGAEEAADLDWTAQEEEQDRGYFVECDLEYPEGLFGEHASLPLAPDNVEVEASMLSPFARRAMKERTREYKAKKLLGWFGPRSKYVTHYLNLKLYLKLGMRLKRVHRVLAFRQAPFIRPYVEETASNRAAAANEFERQVQKLMSNAVFGKTLQDNRKHGTVSFFTDQAKAARAVSAPTLQNFRIINEEVVACFFRPAEVTMDRCYAVGFAILELSKRFVFAEYYERIRPVLGPSCRVLMSDTDSLLLYFYGMSRTAALRHLEPMMDFSNYPPSHPLYDETKKMKLGYWKDEMAGVCSIVEYVGVRSKAYALKTVSLVDGTTSVKNRSKGVCRRQSRRLTFEQYLACLRAEGEVRVHMNVIRARNHRLHTERILKRAFDSFDDKRYLLACGVHSLPHCFPRQWTDDACTACSTNPDAPSNSRSSNATNGKLTKEMRDEYCLQARGERVYFSMLLKCNQSINQRH